MAINETDVQGLINQEINPVTNDSLEFQLTPTELVATTSETQETLTQELKSLNAITSTQNQLVKVKSDLDVILSTINANPSIITKYAKEWGKLPTWQKVAGGAVVSVPLIVGIFAQAGIVLAIGVFSGVAYTASAVILDDHNSCTINIEESLKTGVQGLADVLSTIINALEKIAKDLAFEIEKFKVENLRLTVNIDSLGLKVGELTDQVEMFAATEKLLRNDCEQLEQTSETLKVVVAKNDNLLVKTGEELERVKSEYEKSQKQLCEKVAELGVVRAEMGKEVEKARLVSQTLHGAMNTMSMAILTDSSNREAFQQKLDIYLAGKETSFSQLTTGISDTEKELAKVKDELKEANQRNTELLDRQEGLVKRMEHVAQQYNINIENMPAKVNADGLRNLSIYAKPVLMPATVDQGSQHAMSVA